MVGTFVIVWAPFFLAVDPKTHTRTAGRASCCASWPPARAARAQFVRGLRRQLWCATQPAFPVAEDGGRAAADSGGARGDGRRRSAFHGAPDRAPYERGVPVVPRASFASGFSCSVFQAHGESGAAPSPRRSRWRPPTRTSPRGSRSRRRSRCGRCSGRTGCTSRHAATVLAFAAARGRGAPGAEASEGTKELSVALERRSRTKRRIYALAGTARGLLADTRVATFVAAAGLHSLELFVPPPARFPFLHDLLVTSCCFVLVRRRRRRHGNLRATRSRGGAAPPANPESAARAARASRRTASAAAAEWSLVQLAATPEPNDERRLTAIKKRNGEGR